MVRSRSWVWPSAHTQVTALNPSGTTNWQRISDQEAVTGNVKVDGPQSNAVSFTAQWHWLPLDALCSPIPFYGRFMCFRLARLTSRLSHLVACLRRSDRRPHQGNRRRSGIRSPRQTSNVCLMYRVRQSQSSISPSESTTMTKSSVCVALRWPHEAPIPAWSISVLLAGFVRVVSDRP
jgi:hypothetical protein